MPPPTTPRILALDPGKVTGIALLQREPTALLYSTELPWLEALDVAHSFIAASDRDLVVAAERFIITVQTAKNSQAPWSLQGIGVLIWLLHKYRQPPLALYNPADHKAMFPNDTLRALGLWHKGGEGHARDAIRVGLMCLINTGWVDSRLLRES